MSNHNVPLQVSWGRRGRSSNVYSPPMMYEHSDKINRPGSVRRSIAVSC
jgi:hypothetical protein